MPRARDGAVLASTSAEDGPMLSLPCRDHLLPLAEVAALLGLSERAVLALESRGLPIRRVTPKATPILLESEFLAWLTSQPRRGESVRRRGDGKG